MDKKVGKDLLKKVKQGSSSGSAAAGTGKKSKKKNGKKELVKLEQKEVKVPAPQKSLNPINQSELWKNPSQEVYIVEQILDKRVKRGKAEYLIKWHDWSSADNTWEPLSSLKDCEFALREFERKYAAAQLKKKGIKTDEDSSAQNGSDSDDGLSNYGDPDADAFADDNFELSYVDKIPDGKIPKEVISVVPIDGHLVYIVKWEDTIGQLLPSRESVVGIKAEGFRDFYPQLIIKYFETIFHWKLDVRSPVAQAQSVLDELERSRIFKGESKSSQQPLSANSLEMTKLALSSDTEDETDSEEELVEDDLL